MKRNWVALSAGSVLLAYTAYAYNKNTEDINVSNPTKNATEEIDSEETFNLEEFIKKVKEKCGEKFDNPECGLQGGSDKDPAGEENQEYSGKAERIDLTEENAGNIEKEKKTPEYIKEKISEIVKNPKSSEMSEGLDGKKYFEIETNTTPYGISPFEIEIYKKIEEGNYNQDILNIIHENILANKLINDGIEEEHAEIILQNMPLDRDLFENNSVVFNDGNFAFFLGENKEAFDDFFTEKVDIFSQCKDMNNYQTCFDAAYSLIADENKEMQEDKAWVVSANIVSAWIKWDKEKMNNSSDEIEENS